MPGGDGTGPMGMGSMTGRAAGFCAGYGVLGHVHAAGGRCGGFGDWGRGRGGWGRQGVGRYGGVAPMGAGYPAYEPTGPMMPTREQDVEGLKQQAAHFQGVLEDIQKRIEQLQAESAPPRRD